MILVYEGTGKRDRERNRPGASDERAKEVDILALSVPTTLK